MNFFNFFKPKKQNRESRKPEKRNTPEIPTPLLTPEISSPSSQPKASVLSNPETQASSSQTGALAIPSDPDIYIKKEEIYIPKKTYRHEEKVQHIEISYEQAWEQGWHFKRKSRKRMRITHYTGSDRDVIVPAKIEGHIVNEIGSRAFYGCDIDSVMVPDTVKKLNPSCFCTSTIKKITFAEGITEIPEDTFRSCEHLSKVHLPATLCHIRKRAFYSCKSLSYIKIPIPYFGGSIGEEAFRYSGLNDLAITRIDNGNVFSNTPLHRNYKLILASSDSLFSRRFDYDVALVGSGANITFPGKSVSFGKNSITDNCTLDLSNCSKISINADTYQLGKGRYSRKLTRPDYICEIIIPQYERVYLPHFVRGHFPNDGRESIGYEFIGSILIKRVNGNKTTLWVRGKELPSFSVAFSYQIAEHTKERLEIESEEPLHFHEYAVDDRDVESISFPHICGEGELFSPDCWHLHKVEWKEWNKEYCAYIPSEEILFQWSAYQYFAHRQLLKAFSGRRNKLGLYRFFDSSVIEQVFTEPISNYTEFRRPLNKPLRLSQRSKILIAVDVLRSSESLFENREMYIKYLQSHKRYAKIVCQKLPEKWQEYKDFLEAFYEQN